MARCLTSAVRLAELAVAVTMCTSCATLQPSTFTTASGKPEVDIGGATKLRVRDALVSRMTASGYTVKASSDYALIFEKTASGMANVLYSSRYDSQAMWRVTFNVVDVNGAVKVIGSAGIVTNPGSAFEKLTDLTNGRAGQDVETILAGVRGAFVQPPPSIFEPFQVHKTAELRTPMPVVALPTGLQPAELLFEFIVAPDGTVELPSVQTYGNQAYLSAAKAVLRDARFSPALLADGSIVRQRAGLRIRFH